MLAENVSFPPRPAPIAESATATTTPRPAPNLRPLGIGSAIDEHDLARYQKAFGDHDTEELLRWAKGRFGNRLAVVTAFQAEGIVLLDMLRRITPDLRVITIDTGRLPAETYTLIDKVRRRFDIEVEMLYPDAPSLAALMQRGGPNLFYQSVDDRLACCRVRKVEPLNRALKNLDAWITGLRRDQSPDRAKTPVLARDEAHGGILKLAPLAAWSQDAVWDYIRQHKLPYHPLYDQGFTSIGCAPCTRAITIGESSRAGRWWWESGSHKECGLHLPSSPVSAVAATGGA